MRCLIALLTVGMLITAVTAPGRCSDDGGAKSLGKALMLSLVMPGAGQQYLGNTGRARMMYVSEAAVWTTFAGFRVQGRMREDRYKEMAKLYAGVAGEMDDDYCLALAHYMSSEDYNIDVMREARLVYPYDRGMQLAYFEENGYFGDEAWAWKSQAVREDFKLTRTRSRGSYRRAVLTTGFAVLNRLVSMIDVYLSYRLGDSGRRAGYPSLRAGPGPNEHFRLYISTPF
jgi:hypothetical protein